MYNYGRKDHDKPAYCESRIMSALDTQVGGDHYKNLGPYQPWLILRACMTPEEFRGYIKGTAIAYLLRDGKKGDDDYGKALHTLQGGQELMGGNA